MPKTDDDVSRPQNLFFLSIHYSVLREHERTGGQQPKRMIPNERTREIVTIAKYILSVIAFSGTGTDNSSLGLFIGLHGARVTSQLVDGGA